MLGRVSDELMRALFQRALAFVFPPVEDFVVGFRAGARRASPGIKVMVGYSKDFVDASKCTAIARDQVAKGAGVLFNDAGTCGTLASSSGGRS